MSYDKKFRKRTIEYREEGHTIAETSQTFAISASTVKKWVKQYAENGALEDQPRKRSFKKIDPTKLKAYILEHPDAYQYEMAEEFNCCQKAIWQALRKYGITFKKRRNAINNKML